MLSVYLHFYKRIFSSWNSRTKYLVYNGRLVWSLLQLEKIRWDERSVWGGELFTTHTLGIVLKLSLCIIILVLENGDFSQLFYCTFITCCLPQPSCLLQPGAPLALRMHIGRYSSAAVLRPSSARLSLCFPTRELSLSLRTLEYWGKSGLASGECPPAETMWTCSGASWAVTRRW